MIVLHKRVAENELRFMHWYIVLDAFSSVINDTDKIRIGVSTDRKDQWGETTCCRLTV